MRMPRFFLHLLIALAALSATAQNRFLIRGDVYPQYNGKTIILEYKSGERLMRDSATVIGGTYVFKGRVEEVAKATISLLPGKSDTALAIYDQMMAIDEQQFYLSNDNYLIKGTDLRT